MNFYVPKIFIGFCFFILNSFTSLNASQIEQQLRTSLLTDYNKYTRPVERFNDTLDVTIGLAVQNIESFNQIEETIQLNIWLRKYWLFQTSFSRRCPRSSIRSITLQEVAAITGASVFENR